MASSQLRHALEHHDEMMLVVDALVLSQAAVWEILSYLRQRHSMKSSLYHNCSMRTLFSMIARNCSVV